MVNNHWLVVSNMNGLCFRNIWGMSSFPTDKLIFFRGVGLNHHPGIHHSISHINLPGKSPEKWSHHFLLHRGAVSCRPSSAPRHWPPTPTWYSSTRSSAAMMSGLPGDAWETETETMESRGATMAYLWINADEKLEIFIGFQEDLIWETRWNQWFSAIEGDIEPQWWYKNCHYQIVHGIDWVLTINIGNGDFLLVI